MGENRVDISMDLVCKDTKRTGNVPIMILDLYRIIAIPLYPPLMLNHQVPRGIDKVEHRYRNQ